jgi:hypothetical protein
VARLASDALGYGLTDQDLVSMITINPGDVLKRCWSRQAGRLTPGGFGDVTVLRSKHAGSFWSDVVVATEQDVALVIVGGVPRYGDADLMTAAHAPTAGALKVAGINRQLAVPDPANPQKAWRWSEIIARLDKVRSDPAAALKKAEGKRQAFAGRITDADAPLQIMLDMPSGGMTAFAGRPPKPDDVVIPPLPSLVHDQDFLTAIHGRGFHGTVLDGLAAFYR